MNRAANRDCRPSCSSVPTWRPSGQVSLATYTAVRAHRCAELLPTVDDNSSQGDRTLVLGLQANQAGDYPHAMTLVGESIEQGLSSNQLKAQAHNMRGTFRFIMGNPAGALEDLNLSTDLDRSFIQSWVKKASVHMELGACLFSHFWAWLTCGQGKRKRPSKISPLPSRSTPQTQTCIFDPRPSQRCSHCGRYYHRGQVYFILGNFADAIAQYQKSTELDGHFIYSQIQHGVALYKEGRKEKAELKFKKLMKTFPNAPEVFNYYGELQLDQASTDASFYDKAVANFDRATALEDAKCVRVPCGASETDSWDREGYRNVLPMINKALCLFQKDKSLIEEAEEICRQALAKDPLCDVGVATLAQLYVQQNKIDPAVEMFEKSVELARTEPELTHILQYLNATRAQQKFVAAYPKEAQNLGVLPPASV
jgi:import receptor subunit TOM70